MHGGEVFKAEFFGAMRAIPQAGFLHACLRNSSGCRRRVTPNSPTCRGRATLYRAF
jgi:hypothetical protein